MSTLGIGAASSCGHVARPSPGEETATPELMGGLRFDPLGADFTDWVNGFKDEAYRNWVVPEAALRGARGQVELEFTVERGGAMTGLRLVKSSGLRELDEAAVVALRRSRMPSLPDAFPRERITMEVTFYYNVPAPGRRSVTGRSGG